MNRFYIIPNIKKDSDLQITQRICDYIETKGKSYILAQTDKDGYILSDSVPEDVDCAIVLGGDGTLIQAARDLRGYSIPILGINMGTLGYLAEVELDNIEESLDKLMHDEYFMDIRMMIQGCVNQEEPRTAMNDIVVGRENGIRLINFDIFVNGELLNSYRADGVIISTPTGSTGYNLSAGGPILEPTADMVVITPICSHALNTSSIVLSAKDLIEIEIGETRNGTVEHAVVSFDGKESVSLVTGDRVKIEKTGESVVLLKLSRESFMKTMRRKMKGN